MTPEQIIEACSPVFSAFTDAGRVAWDQYALALSDVNPGDLDDALADVRRSHAFRNAPLPAEIRVRADIARRARIEANRAAERASGASEPILTGEGEPRTFTLGGVSLTVRVLSDEHPALRRFACLRCQDTSWAEGPPTRLGYPSVTRCSCWVHNPVLAAERARQAERHGRRKAAGE